MADRTTRILLEILALDKATAVLGSMMGSLQAWADRMNGVGAETELTSEQLEVAQIRLQGASDAYAVSLEAQAAALGKLEAAQATVAESQQVAVAAQLEAQRAAEEASVATGDEAVALEAYAKTAMRVSADTAAAVTASTNEQVAAYDKLMAADALVEKRTRQVADSQIASNEEAATATAGLGKLAPALLATAAAMGYLGYKSVESAANFQTVMTKLVTSAGESKDMLASVSAGVLTISSQTGIAATELGKAMYYVDSANIHGAASLQVLAAAAKGARDEMANAADVTNALTTVMTNYNIPTSQSVMVMNEMIMAVSRGKTNLQDFSVALAQVLPIAAAAKLSFADVGGALATMTAKGMTAQQAAQDLAATIRNLQGPNGVAIKAMEQFGLSVSDVEREVGTKGLVATIQTLHDTIISKMGPAGLAVVSALNNSKTAATNAKIAFDTLPKSLQGLASELANGTISANNWRLAIRNLSPDQQHLMQQYATLQERSKGFNSFLTSGSTAAKTYTDAMKAMTGGTMGMNVALMLTGGPDGSLDTFKNNVDAIAGVAKSTSTEVDGWTQVQGTFNQKMAEAKQTLTNTGIAIGTALLPPLTKFMGTVIAILTPIAQWVTQHQKLIALLLAIVGPLLAIVGVMLTVTKVIGLVEAATLALGGALEFLAANPIILAITAIIVVAYLLITHWKQVKEVLSAVWGWMKTAAKDVADFFARVWNDVSAFTKRIWGDVANYFKQAWAGFKIIWAATGGKLVAEVEHAWNVVSASFKKEWDRISADLSQIWGELVTIWNDTGGKLVALISGNWDTISAGVSAVWHSVFDPIKKAFEIVMTFVKATLQVLEGVLKGAWDGIRGTVQVYWDLIWGTIKAVWNIIFGIVRGALDFVWGLIKAGFDLVLGVVEIVWDHIKGTINTALDFIRDILKVVIDLITGHWSQAWNDLKKTFINLWNNLKDEFNSILNDIKRAVFGAVTDIAKGFVSGIEDGIKGIVNAFLDVYHAVINAFKDAVHWLEQAAKDVVQGFINGIKSMLGVVGSAAGSVGSTLLDGVKAALGIKSPSVAFHGVGVSAMQGLTNGINVSARAAAQAARTAALGVVAAASGAATGTLTIGAGAPNVFAGAASTAGRPVVNFTADLRGAQIAGPQSIGWITDQLNKNFVQKVLPTSGTTIRHVGG